MKKGLIIGLVLVLLIGGGAAAYFLLFAQKAEQAETSAGAVEGQEEQVQEPTGDPIYLPLDPAFVVNFKQSGTMRYLQLSLQAMSYDQAVVDKVAANMPAVRNKLILLFSGQDYDNLSTAEGKESLRLAVLDSINEVVGAGAGAKVNEVYFTGFVMQ